MHPVAIAVMVVLSASYPVIAHIGVASQNANLTLAAGGQLVFVALLPSLLAGRLWAWCAAPLLFLAGWKLWQLEIAVLPLYLPPILMNLFMAWVFGRTVIGNRTPLVTQFIQAIHGPDDPLNAAIFRYSRRLTWAWMWLFVSLATGNLALALIAEPSGILLIAGIHPWISVPQVIWSAFANLFDWLVVAAFMVLEYAFRRRHFPQQPYRNIVDFIRKLFAVRKAVFGKKYFFS